MKGRRDASIGGLVNWGLVNWGAREALQAETPSLRVFDAQI